MAAASVKSRRQAVHAFKRGAILEAARRIFAARGLEGATIRAIAEEAGYSPGAIYAYYAAKEEIFGEVLAESLAEAGQALKRAFAAAAPGERLGACVAAYHAYYREHPREFDLGLLLFQGARPVALPPELDRLLNGRLIALLQTIAKALGERGGASTDEVNRETVAILCHASGLLMLENSGRLGVLGFSGEALLGHYLDGVTARLGARA